MKTGGLLDLGGGESGFFKIVFSWWWQDFRKVTFLCDIIHDQRRTLVFLCNRCMITIYLLITSIVQVIGFPVGVQAERPIEPRVIRKASHGVSASTFFRKLDNSKLFRRSILKKSTKKTFQRKGSCQMSSRFNARICKYDRQFFFSSSTKRCDLQFLRGTETLWSDVLKRK